MPIFHMSIFKVPSSILKSLESIRSRFFNGQDPKSNKASWVKWNKVLTPKDKGGLGVSSLFALNRGLMLKWVWRFYSHKCSLWTKVIKAIYGEDGNLNKDVSGGVRTCWTSIVHEVRVLQGRGINVADYIRLKLGNGENTRFWLDNWYEGGVIKELFPHSIQTQRVLEGVYIWSVVVYVELSHKFVDKKIPEKALIFDNLVSSSFYWCKFRCKASFKWDDWLKNPYIVLV
ncbi:hypothetical protein Tco_1515288 [Tanacetum coccineum]